MSSRVYIGNLPTDAEDRELEDICEKYGKLRSLDMKGGRDGAPKFAFADYEDPRDASECVRAENGREFAGNRMRVRTRVLCKPLRKHISGFDHDAPTVTRLLCRQLDEGRTEKSACALIDQLCTCWSPGQCVQIVRIAPPPKSLRRAAQVELARGERDRFRDGGDRGGYGGGYGGRGDGGYGRDRYDDYGGRGGGGGGGYGRDRYDDYGGRGGGGGGFAGGRAGLGPSPYGPSRKTEWEVIVTGLEPNMSWQDLKDHFRTFRIEVTHADVRSHAAVSCGSCAARRSAAGTALAPRQQHGWPWSLSSAPPVQRLCTAVLA